MLEEVDVSVAGVVHHGIDLDARQVNASFLRSIGKAVRRKLVALTIANNDPRKGLNKLLLAYQIVESKVPNSFLVLHSGLETYYGSEEKRHGERCCDLKEMVSKLGIKRAWLTNQYGRLAFEEVNALYKLSHIYVLSSFTEGFGLPILEAYRFNRPVVAVDAPPFNEIIEDGRTGRLIPYSEVRWFDYKNKVLFKMHVYEHHSLAEAMTSLLSSDSLRESMEAHIRREKHRWSIQRLYPKLLDYF